MNPLPTQLHSDVPRDPALDPILDGTQKDMAFFAWQSAQASARTVAAGELDLMREAFEGWWNGRDFSYFANLRQLARAAWNFSFNETESQMTLESDRAAFAAFWQTVVETGKRLAGTAGGAS